MIEKPYAPSCERNQEVILQALKDFIPSDAKNLFEVGSGTGQHAVFCAPHFPQLTWFPSDKSSNHRGIKIWLDEFKIKNIEGPLEYEIGKNQFPNKKFDVVFTANTFHIMSWKNCETLIESLGKYLSPKVLVLIYGAFKYRNSFTSESNQQFDLSLKERDSQSGIRDFEKILQLFEIQNFNLVEDREMPANNRFLVFSKKSVSQ